MASGTALVLSGGGARGADEVGVAQGLVEVIGKRAEGPFDVYAGTSVGAINATYLAANGDRADLGIDGLVALWESLRIDEHVRLDPAGLFGWPLGARTPDESTLSSFGRARRRVLARLAGRDPN